MTQQTDTTVDAWQQLKDAVQAARPVPCQQTSDPEAWWPDGSVRSERTDRAIEQCGRCPASVACRTYAVAAGERHGIWGGTRPGERKR